MTRRRREMPGLSKESVEYIFSRFQSPHLSRKYGHKLSPQQQDPYIEAMRALSEVLEDILFC